MEKSFWPPSGGIHCGPPGKNYSNVHDNGVGVVCYTQSILKRNKHLSKAPTTSATFSHLHTKASDTVVEEKWRVVQHQTDKVGG